MRLSQRSWPVTAPADSLTKRLSACDLPDWTQEQAQPWWKAHMGAGAAPTETEPQTTVSTPTKTWPHVPVPGEGGTP